MKYLDYRLTKEGQDLKDKSEDPEIDNLLEKVYFGYHEEVSPSSSKIVSKLLSKGYLAYSDIDTLIEELPDPDLRRLFRLYYRMARNRPVDNTSLDWARNYLKKRIKRDLVKRVGYKGIASGKETAVDSCTGSPSVTGAYQDLDSAQTPKEIRLAIDRGIGLIHCEGGGPLYFSETGSSRLRERSDLTGEPIYSDILTTDIDRILTRLSTDWEVKD